MKTKRGSFKFFAGAALFAALAVPGGLPAQAQQRTGVSRSMEQAIRLYHEGENTEAMDRFMDILVKGSPSEKALANDYISKITLRMNTGVNTVKNTETEVGTMNTVKPAARAGTEQVVRGAKLEEEQVASDSEDGFSDEEKRKAVSEKINAKIAQMRRDILLEISQNDPVKVYIGENGQPNAISLDPTYFFAGETTFRPGTDKMLGLVSGLLFTLGRVNCTVLPEGAAGGDVKIKAIRRALSLNSYLEARGVSKSKLEVNLTGNDITYPKELNNISGMLILLTYDKEPRLKDLEDMQTKGPKVSLGLYPTAISVHNGEGAVVEFSAFESPVGQPTWTFQIFQVQKDGNRLLLQEFSGQGAQYNQSYWNGRAKFFGAPFPSGKYVFTVTAKDIEGRETSLSRLLVIRPTPAEEKAMAARPAQKSEPADDTSVTGSGVKTKLVKAGAAGKAGKVISGAKKGAKPAKKGPAGKKGKTAAKAAAPSDGEEEAAPKKTAAKDGGQGDDSQGELSGRVSYKVYFKENTATITQNSEKKLSQVAETLGMYPMAKVSLTGYAYSGEANAEALAENRVNYVASRLSEKFKIDRTRMDIQSKVSETPKSTVEILMTGE